LVRYDYGFLILWYKSFGFFVENAAHFLLFIGVAARVEFFLSSFLAVFVVLLERRKSTWLKALNFLKILSQVLQRILLLYQLCLLYDFWLFHLSKNCCETWFEAWAAGIDLPLLLLTTDILGLDDFKVL
jgi:hypothetical protein